AGGVGLIACQWLASIGATVIGTVGSDEKAALAKEHGCAHVINYSTESFKDRVLEITDGKGVPVVYDGVGARTFMDSLDCLQRLGMMVTFGNASGPVPEITPALLGQKGGLFLTRPSTAHYFVTREELKAGSADLFAAVTSGAVKIRIGASYPLAEAKQAHIDLEDRKSLGSTILTIG
ncbi:MAG: zinc-binding dehydrogenase, partial [Rhodospirillaceae bacterium]